MTQALFIKLISKAYNHQNKSFENIANNLFSFKDFLKAFTSDSVVEGALKKQYFIEEEEIVTVPENVPGYMLTNMNDELLLSARQYFTEDAWICLSNTLDVIKGKKVHVLFCA